MFRMSSGGMKTARQAAIGLGALQWLFTIDALAAETARVVSLPRLHEGGLAGLGAVIAVAGLIAWLRRGR